jgi:hypothetical protein
MSIRAGLYTETSSQGSSAFLQSNDSNFLFDVSKRQGVLVDFGLAEYQDPSDVERCPCSSTNRKHDHATDIQRLSRPLGEGPGYLKYDQRFLILRFR